MIMTSQHNSPCGICHKNILKGQKAIFCNECCLFVHIKCNGISTSEYRELENEPDVHWFCKLCIQDVFTFGSLGNEDLAALYEALAEMRNTERNTKRNEERNTEQN